MNQDEGKIVVIGDSPTCTGFRLAGLEMVMPLSGRDAEAKIEELLERQDVSIIIVNEKIMNFVDWRLKRKIEKTAKPVVIAIPDKEGPSEETDSLRSMVKKALGFELMK
jgi:vacuolar-type H+-ATPase subunit F/Vma7